MKCLHFGVNCTCVHCVTNIPCKCTVEIDIDIDIDISRDSLGAWTPA